MPNTTDTYWSVDGTSLQTYVQNIETKGGSRWGVAPLRGADNLIPLAPGEEWNRKIAGARILTLQMWLAGESEQEWTDNWIALRKLLWRTNRRINLTKRWKGVDNVVRSAVAKAEFYSGLEPGMISDDASKFTVDLKLADPYFYGTETSVVVGTAGIVAVNDGDDIARKVRVENMSTSKTLQNLTNGRDLSLSAGGSGVTIDSGAWTVTGGTANEGDVVVAGNKREAYWFTLDPGDNDLDINTGTATVYWTPVYL